MRLAILGLGMVMGCTDPSSSGTGTEPMLDGGTDDSAPTDPSSTGCTALSEGRWTGDGPAFGMEMGATLTLDVSGCSFTFSDWSMAMDVPAGGTVAGDEVTLNGSAYWESCSGTATSSDAFTVVCADDGASLEMAHD